MNTVRVSLLGKHISQLLRSVAPAGVLPLLLVGLGKGNKPIRIVFAKSEDVWQPCHGSQRDLADMKGSGILVDQMNGAYGSYTRRGTNYASKEYMTPNFRVHLVLKHVPAVTRYKYTLAITSSNRLM